MQSLLTLPITEKNYQEITKFKNEEIDHFFIKNPDGLNYYLICHGSPLGKVFFNNKLISLSDLTEEIKSELHIEITTFIDVICCFGVFQNSFMEKGFRIKSAFRNIKEIYYKYTKNMISFCCQAGSII